MTALDLVAGFSDLTSLPVLPFWGPVRFKIHLEMRKLPSRFKCSEFEMENQAETTENFASWLSLPRSR